ncbi:MAG: FkbM family methyltransferase [Proteobacteria bacterium]|nr:FkbM family methyltransferase [Pseudomonadota bacterium]
MSIDIAAVEQFLPTAPRSVPLYQACRAYVWRFDGENDPDPYTNGEWRTLGEYMPHCRVVFDVGAHRGDWTETVLTINPDLEIHAFEPSRDGFDRIAAKNLPPRVRCNNVGLGARAEQRQLYTLGVDSEMRSLYPRAGLEEYGIDVPPAGEPVTITTLDAYCQAAGVDAIDYLKIDTEGHDLQVLRGAAGMIGRRAIRYIQFEYGSTNVDSRDLLKDFFAFFDETPYRLHKIHPEGYRHYPRYNVRLENFQYQNWLAVGET